MKRIPLTQGKFALVDDEDFEWLKQWKWQAYKARRGHLWYAKHSINLGNGRFKKVAMQQLITGAVYPNIADHKDHDGLNNQRYNLRVCNYRQNAQHSRIAAGTATGLKGVRFRKRNSTFEVYITKPARKGNSPRIYLGGFKCPTEAGRAYDAAAKKYFGEYAALNFPDD